MSRIYFHSPSRETEVMGSERAMMGHYVSELFLMALGVSDYDYPNDPHVLRNILEPSHYAAKETGRQFASMLSVALRVGMDSRILVVDGEAVNVFAASLNTAIVMGSDPIILSARLHGQCEIHTYVEGANRAWLAGIIERGLASGIFRSDSGWESVIEHLRERDDEPVVTSYSVCEQFPNAGAAGWKPDKVNEEGDGDWDAYYDLPSEEQWRMGMEALRAKLFIEMTPDKWAVSIAFGTLRHHKLRLKSISTLSLSPCFISWLTRLVRRLT